LFAVCRCASQLEIDRSSSSQSSVEDARDARTKFSLQIVSVDDAEFENLLRDAVSNGNQQFHLYITAALT